MTGGFVYQKIEDTLSLTPEVLQLKPLVLDRRRTLYRVYIRELDRELCIGLSTLYINT